MENTREIRLCHGRRNLGETYRLHLESYFQTVGILSQALDGKDLFCSLGTRYGNCICIALLTLMLL